MLKTCTPRALAVLATAALGACTQAPSPLVPQLRAALPPGVTLAAAETELRRHATTYSIKTAAECDEIGRTDVILQLVFTPDGRLADGNFEELRSLR